MSSEWVIHAQNLSKCYTLFDRPADRLKQMLWLGKRRFYREFWALRNINIELRRGEVLGIIGNNGAGKSTLLQLLCGTLTPSSGNLEVRGRIAALLELGAGFNPEFTGRENIFLSASILGLPKDEIDRRFNEIVDFSGIGAFIDQPVKTYSSGMYVRLAFSIATSVDPDILVIDEALSVGDGEFARRSFERIMQFKESGKSIIFCSHNLFQVDALCSHALWLDRGEMRASGPSHAVLTAYASFLEDNGDLSETKVEGGRVAIGRYVFRTAAIVSPTVDHSDSIVLKSGVDDLQLNFVFTSDPDAPAPSIGIGIRNEAGQVVASAGSLNDGNVLMRDNTGQGSGEACLVFPRLPLLKGRYWIDAYLMCERGIFVHDEARGCGEFLVIQDHLEQGVVTLPHHWKIQGHAEAPMK